MYQLSDVQQVTLNISGIDLMGNPATIKGANWSVSDTSVLTVTPSQDGTSAVVATTGKLGSSQVKVQAQGPKGPVSGTLDVEIVGSDAVAITVNVSKAPENRPSLPTTPVVPPSSQPPAPPVLPH